MSKLAIPKTLSKQAADFYQQTITAYNIDDAVGRMHVQLACEALDRIHEAQEAIKQNRSLTTRDRNGILRPHPALTVERNARTAYCAAFKLLRLEPPSVK